jgi:uncharacterized protein YciI
MAYMAFCIDGHTNAQALRHEQLAAHLDYIESLGPQLLVTGPLNLNDAKNFDGSLFVYDVESEQEARTLLADDPYYIAGIYGDIQFAVFLPARGCWT